MEATKEESWYWCIWDGKGGGHDYQGPKPKWSRCPKHQPY